MRESDEVRDRSGGEHVGERLDAYRTGELDAEARLRVEAHLEACARCREELAALASWAAAIERGYEARLADADSLEPDWAAQRSAIVERTAGRRAAEGRRAFGRWAPQIALVALAALIVGIVWRENPMEREALQRPQSARPAEEAGERLDAAAEAPAAPDMDAAAEAPPPATPPAAMPEQARRQARPTELEKQAVPEADEGRAENQEALADRAAEPSLAAGLSDVERFEREARASLRARDTVGARRALALWSDTLAASGDTLGAAAALAREPALLADSLREFLEHAE